MTQINDIGRFVATYFRVLAWLVILGILIRLFMGQIRLDITFLLLFWAAHHLERHSRRARFWSLLLLGLTLAGCVAMVGVALAIGPQGLDVTIGVPIERPTIWHVLGVVGFFIGVIGIPFALLLTPQARREFGKNDQSANDVDATRSPMS